MQALPKMPSSLQKRGGKAASAKQRLALRRIQQNISIYLSFLLPKRSDHRFVAGKLAVLLHPPLKENQNGIEPMDAAYQLEQRFIPQVLPFQMNQLVPQYQLCLLKLPFRLRQDDEGAAQSDQGRSRRAGAFIDPDPSWDPQFFRQTACQMLQPIF